MRANQGTHLLDAINPIRNFVQQKLAAVDITGPRPPEVLNFSVGDPTFYDFKPNPGILKAAADSIGPHHDYTDIQGSPQCREFLAKLYSNSRFTLTKDEITLTSGGSMALILSLLALTDPGDNILVPVPGFPLMRAVASAFGTQVRDYHLNSPDFQVEVSELQTLIDQRTKFILVNDPSNPLGTLMRKESKLQILELCKKRGIPLVADEIYEDMIFKGEWQSFAELTDSVPIIRCSGLTKKYCVPGWRMGFLVLYGQPGVFDEVKRGIRNWCSIFMMPNTITQKSLVAVMTQPEEPARLKDMMSKIGQYIEKLTVDLSSIKGITCGKAQAAMYLPFSCDLALYDFKDVEDLALLIFKEENVKVFPGSLFGDQDSTFCRMVVCMYSEEVLLRFKRFFGRHQRP